MVDVQGKLCLLWTLLGLHFVAFASANIQYGIMIDAGSSGTRLEIYSSADEDGALKVSEMHQVKAEPHKVKPGLASFYRPEDIEAYLQPLLNVAQNAIPADHHNTTPIFLMGTAGMRLLSEQDAKVVINAVVKLFSDKAKCPFKFKANNAQVITGKWEGIYAWITVNFLEGVFAAPSDTKTYGILDLGGASHQNTFQTPQNRPEHENLTLGGRYYDIFSRTYLGYGMDQAREKFQYVLVKGNNCSGSEVCLVKNPCQLKGYKEAKDIEGMKYEFTGQPNITKCRSIIKKSFFCNEVSKDCPFHDQPRLRGPFLGRGALYNTLRDIGMLGNTNTVSPWKVGSASQAYCKQSYDDVSDDPFAHKNCFDGNYIFELFNSGYKLHPTKNIIAQSSLNGFDLGWTLGALLYNTKML